MENTTGKDNGTGGNPGGGTGKDNGTGGNPGGGTGTDNGTGGNPGGGTEQTTEPEETQEAERER